MTLKAIASEVTLLLTRNSKIFPEMKDDDFRFFLFFFKYCIVTMRNNDAIRLRMQRRLLDLLNRQQIQNANEILPNPESDDTFFSIYWT
jgi:hypothetical protein